MFSILQAELGKPSLLQPDRGKVAIFVDCSPTAAPMFEVGMFNWYSVSFTVVISGGAKIKEHCSMCWIKLVINLFHINSQLSIYGKFCNWFHVKYESVPDMRIIIYMDNGFLIFQSVNFSHQFCVRRNKTNVICSM